jgi:decaprenyl-diphosphate synthase subunit 2
MNFNQFINFSCRSLVYSNDKTHQTRGLLVLLVSKAAKIDQTQDIMPEQRTLAEITELVHTAHLIHTGVINLNTPNVNLEMGNKMAVLCGDFFLAHSCVQLASLQNIKVCYLCFYFKVCNKNLHTI